MASKTRLYTILAIGLFAVLSVAVVLTAITVTRYNVSSSTRSEEGKVKREAERKKCSPPTADELKKVLAKICGSREDLLLNVSYGREQLKCGQLTTAEKTATIPSVQLKHANKQARYTMVMIDPDAPKHSLESLRFYLHWLNIDLMGSTNKNGMTTTSTLMSYVGPTPPKGTGVHRYQMIVFQSSEPYDQTQLLQDNKKRDQFSLDEFVTKNNLCSIVGLFEFTVAADKN